MAKKNWLDAAIELTELAISIQTQAAAVFELHYELVRLLLDGVTPRRHALEKRKQQMEALRGLHVKQAQQLRDSLLALRRVPGRSRKGTKRSNSTKA